MIFFVLASCLQSWSLYTVAHEMLKLIPRCYVFSGTWKPRKSKTYCRSLLISLSYSVIGMESHLLFTWPSSRFPYREESQPASGTCTSVHFFKTLHFEMILDVIEKSQNSAVSMQILFSFPTKILCNYNTILKARKLTLIQYC